MFRRWQGNGRPYVDVRSKSDFYNATTLPAEAWVGLSVFDEPVGPSCLDELADNAKDCGTGAGGFKKGNTCSVGHGAKAVKKKAAERAAAKALSKLASHKSKFVGKRIVKVDQDYSAALEREAAKALGGVWQGEAATAGEAKGAKAGQTQRDKKPYDVLVTGKGREYGLEIKGRLKGAKDELTVHDDALLRKASWQQAGGKDAAGRPKRVFHTVAVDDRDTYEGGAHEADYSGNRLYYKRGSGRYPLAKMQKCKDWAEVKRLMLADDKDLPPAAKGKLPVTRVEVASLRAKAEKAHAARLAKDRNRKARIKAELAGG